MAWSLDKHRDKFTFTKRGYKYLKVVNKLLYRILLTTSMVVLIYRNFFMFVYFHRNIICIVEKPE
jgi:hypothetical protein